MTGKKNAFENIYIRPLSYIKDVIEQDGYIKGVMADKIAQNTEYRGQSLPDKIAFFLDQILLIEKTRSDYLILKESVLSKELERQIHDLNLKIKELKEDNKIAKKEYIALKKKRTRKMTDTNQVNSFNTQLKQKLALVNKELKTKNEEIIRLRSNLEAKNQAIWNKERLINKQNELLAIHYVQNKG